MTSCVNYYRILNMPVNIEFFYTIKHTYTYIMDLFRHKNALGGVVEVIAECPDNNDFDKSYVDAIERVNVIFDVNAYGDFMINLKLYVEIHVDEYKKLSSDLLNDLVWSLQYYSADDIHAIRVIKAAVLENKRTLLCFLSCKLAFVPLTYREVIRKMDGPNIRFYLNLLHEQDYAWMAITQETFNEVAKFDYTRDIIDFSMFILSLLLNADLNSPLIENIGNAFECVATELEQSGKYNNLENITSEVRFNLLFEVLLYLAKKDYNDEFALVCRYLSHPSNYTN